LKIAFKQDRLSDNPSIGVKLDGPSVSSDSERGVCVCERERETDTAALLISLICVLLIHISLKWMVKIAKYY